jgi:hypothetical protein
MFQKLIITLTFIKELLANNTSETIFPYKFTDFSSSEYSNALAIYYLKFSSLSYCYVDEIREFKCCPELFNEAWKIIEADKIDYDNYNFVILKHDFYKRVIITFPGTRAILQLIKEIWDSDGISLPDDPTIKIMDYFMLIYVGLRDKVRASLKDVFSKYPDYQYVFTGHSLGGAIASIMAFDAMRYKIIEKTSTSPMLITYGQPRTGNDVFANELMKLIPTVYRVVRQGDLVSHIPFCSYSMIVFGLCNSILPGGKFSESLVLDENQKKTSVYYFYTWHAGGLKIYDYNMDTYIDCLNEYGENNPDPSCIIYPSYFDVFYHTYYFGYKVSSICSIGRRNHFLE